MTWPALPKTVEAPRGPIRIKRVRFVPDDEGVPTDDLGRADPNNRVIYLKMGLRRENAWHILLHEIVHMWLHDGNPGLYQRLEEDLHEDVVEAMTLGLYNFLPRWTNG